MHNVTAALRGLRVIQPSTSLYEKFQLVLENGVVHVSNENPVRVPLAFFGNKSQYLVKNQVFYTVIPHPTALISTKVTAAELIGTVEDECDTSHSKEAEGTLSRLNASRTSETVKNTRESEKTAGAMSYDELDPVRDLEELNLGHVLDSHREKLQEMLREFSPMWDDSFGKVSNREHRIDLLPGTKHIAQHPYRADPKAREEKEFQVSKMLRPGLIEPAGLRIHSQLYLLRNPMGPGVLASSIVALTMSPSKRCTLYLLWTSISNSLAMQTCSPRWMRIEAICRYPFVWKTVIRPLLPVIQGFPALSV